MLVIIEKIIPKSTMDVLNPIELSLIIYSAFFHDIGMACSDDEKSKLIDSKEFKDFYNSFEDEDRDFVFSEFIRKYHAQRSYDFITKNYKKIISYKNIDYSECLANICLGHCLDNSDLKNEKLFPKQELIEEYECNINYLALILRLADYLDIFPRRAPLALYKFVSPKNKVSIIEWQKHMSISGWKFTPNKIRISAKCKNIDYERAIRETLKGINAEKKEIYALIKDYNNELSKKYKFQIAEDISLDDIKNDGSYIFDDLEFDIDYKSVLTLLMGEKLYASPEVALRELLQNSIDAINFRKKLQKEKFEPYIEINFDGKTLSITDNGIGMDDYIFKNYFLKVGKSFYKSKDARSLVSNYDSISEFGIGILSCFMVADSIEVESKRFSQDTNKPNEPICVEIPTAYSYMIKKKSKKQQVGTRITLNLKENHPFENIASLIREITPCCKYDISLRENGKLTILKAIDINKIPFFETDDFFTKEIYFTLDFRNAEEPILRDIEGKIYFILPQERHKKFFDKEENKMIICQEGFEISGGDILPYSIKVYCLLNLTKKAKLTLNTERNCFLRDAKYEYILELIEKHIYQNLIKYLNEIESQYTKKDFEKFIHDVLLYSVNLYGKRYHDNGIDRFINFTFLDQNATWKKTSLCELRKYKKVIFIEKNDKSKIKDAKSLLKSLAKKFKNYIPVVLWEELKQHNNIGCLDGLYFDKYIVTDIPELTLFLYDIEKQGNYDDFEIWGMEIPVTEKIISINRNHPIFIKHPLAGAVFNYNHRFFKSFIHISECKQFSLFSESEMACEALMNIDYKELRKSFKKIFTEIHDYISHEGLEYDYYDIKKLSEKDLP